MDNIRMNTNESKHNEIPMKYDIEIQIASFIQITLVNILNFRIRYIINNLAFIYHIIGIPSQI